MSGVACLCGRACLTVALQPAQPPGRPQEAPPLLPERRQQVCKEEREQQQRGWPDEPDQQQQQQRIGAGGERARASCRGPVRPRPALPAPGPPHLQHAHQGQQWAGRDGQRSAGRQSVAQQQQPQLRHGPHGGADQPPPAGAQTELRSRSGRHAER